MPGSMDGLKLAHAVHDRWPSIKIILVSGQVKPSDAETPADSRFFRKPLGVEEMTTQLQAMIGAGALKIVSDTTAASAEETSFMYVVVRQETILGLRINDRTFAFCWKKP